MVALLLECTNLERRGVAEQRRYGGTRADRTVRYALLQLLQAPAKFIVLNTKFLVFDTQFLVFDTRFLVVKYKIHHL